MSETSNPYTPKLAEWALIAVAAVGMTVGISGLASIGQGRETSPEEFLPEAHAQSDKLRYIHSTSTGAVTMLNGDVHRRFGETSSVYTGDLRSRMWYEDCTYPYLEGIRLCSIETVVYDGVRYQKIDTSEGPGEWEVMGKDPPSPYSYPTGEPYDPEELLKWLAPLHNLVELEPDTVDGTTYRRFRGVSRPGEERLKLLDSGEWEPESIEGLSREEQISALQTMMETEMFTDEFWVREDSSRIWRMRLVWEKSGHEEFESVGALLPQRRSTVVEYSRYNEPVEIRPPY